MKRYKFICPICKKNQLAERKRERRLKNAQSDVTTIRRKCNYMSYCFRTGKYLCPNCLIKTSPYYTKDEFARIVNDANKSITIIGNYIDSQTPIDYKCNICGSIYKGKPYDLLKGRSGCRNCNQSNGERIISLYLLEHDVKYEIEKIFDDCRYKRPLRFDFYLPDFNIAIEYDGKQHFEPIQFSIKSDAGDNLQNTKTRDAIKTDYCKRNNIELIRIKYTDKDIFKTLDSTLLPFLK